MGSYPIADQLLVKKFILYDKLNQKPQENWSKYN